MAFRVKQVKIPMPKAPKGATLSSRVFSHGANRTPMKKDSSANHKRYDFGKDE